MRVLMINVVCGIRSTGRICTDQAAELERQGHEVRIAYGRGEVPEPYRRYAVRIGGDRDVLLHVLRARLGDAAGFGSRGATRRFLSWADAYDPELLLLHNLHGYYIHIGELFRWIKGRPAMKVRWTLHDCWAFTGHCAHYMAVGCERWKTGCSRPCPEKGSYPESILRDRCEENYRQKRAAFQGVSDLTLITPSEWLAGETRSSFLREYPVEVRHNTIDRTLFHPTEGFDRSIYGLQGKRIALGAASTWTKRKGWDDFMALAKLLPDDYRVVLVGVTQKQRAALPAHIIGVERTDSRQELAALYTAADFFVNLTYEENYPTVNLEAAACGTRIITYDTGGCRETIGADDFLVSTGDVGRVAEIIRQATRTGG